MAGTLWRCGFAGSVAFTSCLFISAQAQNKVDFVREVQPIFNRSCIGCHGEKLQMGGLRLDSKALASKAFKPGDSAHSSLYQRTAGIGEQARMPMGGKPLPAAEIELLKRWIDEGADWPDTASIKAEIKKHWAFVPPVRPATPAVSNPAWARNPVDSFILARLDKEGIKPSPEADKVTLLRRLSLDLVGLPPTPAEVDAFLADSSKNAYEKQVDRLLSSAHYGERWGRHWLDAARYADSDGFEKDKQRWVWFYRDWVINALNKDLPYNRFVVEQIAGDLLPNPTQDQLVATGFLRNSMINEEGGIDPEQFRMEAMFDRMDAIGKSVLGITIQCAQCHNHKYDPLTQEEYYRIFAFLNNSNEGSTVVYTPIEQQKRAELFRRIREIEAGLQHRMPDWQSKMAAWEKQISSNLPAWSVIQPPAEDISNGGQKYLPLKDGSILAGGYAPTKHKVKFMLETELKQIGSLQLELLTDPNLPRNGPGRSLLGTGALSEIEIEVAQASDPKKFTKAKFASATADLNPPERELAPYFDDKSDRRRVTGPVAYAIDGKTETAWTSDAGPGRRNQPCKAVFVLDKPIVNEGGKMLVNIYLNQSHGGWNSDDNQSNNLGRFRMSVTEGAATVDPVPAAVRQILSVPADKRTPAQAAAVFSVWRTTVPEWKSANDEIEALWQEHPEGSSQLILSDRQDSRSTHMLTRGDFLKPNKEVTPGVPSFLNPLPANAKPDRLAFANWLVDRNAPTTARAMVNRVWQSYFGTGIVATSEDLGKQSETPSHPELLDWLAVEFMDKGWSLKQLHRTIVTSAAYRQTSRVTPELQQKDPFNRLIARGPRVRVEGEIVRDIALTASGLLNDKVGGPSVYPPAPDFLFQPPVSYGPKNWYEEKGENRYRRALYTFRYRSVPYPMLQNFDTPNGDMSCVRRSRSNTPLQALTTLNEPLFMEAAQALAIQTLKDGGSTDDARLTYAFRRCLSRKPTEGEASELLNLLARQRSRLTEGWISAPDLAGFKAPKALPPGVTPVQAAAWTAVSRVLLNLDETITKE